MRRDDYDYDRDDVIDYYGEEDDDYVEEKSRLVALLILFFCGDMFGIHNFYLGRTKLAWIQLGLSASVILSFGLMFLGGTAAGLGIFLLLAAMATLVVWYFVDLIWIVTAQRDWLHWGF